MATKLRKFVNPKFEFVDEREGFCWICEVETHGWCWYNDSSCYPIARNICKKCFDEEAFDNGN